MALRHAVLAALSEGEASGYELSKNFDVSVANFWSATPQQLYRELERLEADGLLHGRVVEQQRRPNKRVFRLTDAGRAELRAFVAQPARPTAIRDDLLVKLQAADTEDLPSVRNALTSRLEQARDKLARYDRLRDALLDGRDEDTYLRDTERIGPYLTLLGGRMYEQQNISWCTTVLGLLDERMQGQHTGASNEERT
ncbi:PadR family transcriptional regulator [Plantactinospora sp. S1510]|uniref:PadR family transcriptional regulator n=1 Tax=Plantactinospora alkalitolerans TaxID=2789879 RepID=A0ABS0GVM5_9ACTN|nr:PadR family transcriptional regulator [Plantactinospora alkalitolerans]MBF9130263.1 PadR family transcriptional regulator [Plantactinospora alkalitolerans]